MTVPRDDGETLHANGCVFCGSYDGYRRAGEGWKQCVSQADGCQWASDWDAARAEYLRRVSNMLATAPREWGAPASIPDTTHELHAAADADEAGKKAASELFQPATTDAEHRSATPEELAEQRKSWARGEAELSRLEREEGRHTTMVKPREKPNDAEQEARLKRISDCIADGHWQNATVTRAEQAESRIAELESENARLKAAIEPAIEWARAELRASGNTHRSALFRSLVAGGFIEQSGERGK